MEFEMGNIKVVSGQHWLRVTESVAGWMVVEWWMNNEEKDVLMHFPEPYEVHMREIATKQEGIDFALQLGNALNLKVDTL